MPGREGGQVGLGRGFPHSHNIFHGPLLAVEAVIESRPLDLALGHSCGCLKSED
jgi:hypothetical protein